MRRTFRPGGARRRGAVLFAAHLDTGMEFKGLGTLLQAVANLVSEGVDITLEVVGSGQLLPSYRAGQPHSVWGLTGCGSAAT